MARDDARIGPTAKTLLLDHGARTPWSVVLFHGFTNHPGQFAQFAAQLHARGANVLVPRMPLHGYADRMTDALKSLTAEMLLACSYESVDAAVGLGERVAVAGLSMGGSISAYLGQYRADIATSMPIAPDFGLLNLPRWALDVLAPIVLAIPNFFLWWDPRAKENQLPKTAYPRFSTHALMQTVRIGSAVYHAANREPARAGRIATVVNTHDPAVSNAVTLQVVRRWQRLRAGGIEYVELTDLPENHDIIDPENPLARTDLVYPKLIDVLAIC
jgi:alpha-beta hydrolase superfamily lysophospholipase